MNGTRPLTHPVFWGALALLVVNDHVLKTAGWLPTVVTGKLSDFAGLVVAPVVLCALLRARKRSVRLSCFAATGAVFSAINLSPALAALWGSALASVGIGFRTYSDPTDLVGLVALPVAWHVVHAERPRQRGEALARVGLVAGAFACMATSQVPPDADIFFQTTTFLANGTHEPVNVRVRWLDGTVDCADLVADDARMPSRASFGPGITFDVEADGVLPFERNEAARAAGIGAETLGFTPRGDCDAVLVQGDRLSDTVVAWNGVASRRVSPSATDARTGSGAVDVVEDDDLLRLAPGPIGAVVVAPFVERPEVAACDMGYATPLEWSVLDDAAVGTQRLTAVDPGPDGCLALDLVDALDAPHRLFLCVPEWAFPFAPDTDVRIDTSLVGDRVTFFGEDAAGVRYELSVVHGVTALSADNVGIEATVAPLGCGGARTSCGEYRVPEALHVRATGDEIVPGDVLGLDAATAGRPARLFLGRAETYALIRDACGITPRALHTPNVDALVLFEEVE